MPFVPSFASFVVYTQPRSFYPLTFVPFAFYTPHTYNFAHPKICLIFVNPSSDKPHLLSLGEAGRGLISPHRSMHPLRPLMPPASRCHKMCNHPCVGIPPMSNQHNRFITSIRSPLCPSCLPLRPLWSIHNLGVFIRSPLYPSRSIRHTHIISRILKFV